MESMTSEPTPESPAVEATWPDAEAMTAHPGDAWPDGVEHPPHPEDGVLPDRSQAAPPEPGIVTDVEYGYPVEPGFSAADEDDSDDEDFAGLNDYEEDE